jgi:hypothetical protein
MNVVDMMIHVHPEMDMHARTDLEKSLAGRIGVDCAEFTHTPHSHSLLVKYDPEAVNGSEILQMVRKVDPVATIIGM